ncbi:MAG TPA: MFS transporter [Gammaproteobacteria bacterium]
MQHVARPRRAAAAIPRGVWALGFVSLFMDISSEMIHALLPVFLVSVLGTSVAAVGLLEGTAEAIAQVTKVFSGTLSDWLGKRKLLTVVGYGLAALTKPLFALAPSAGWVFAARGLDRVGKGIRGAPRDALIADLAPQEIRGAAFGLRQTLDTVGAFAGPLLAIALMAATADDFRAVFWLATIPAFVSVIVLVLFVREPDGAVARRPAATQRVFALVGALGSRFWWLVVVATLFTLARFSEAFLILKVADVGLGLAYVPAVLVVMNVAYALSAYPAGWLSDRMNRWGVFAVGTALLIAADLVLAFGSSIAAAGIGVALWGLHMGFTQGLLAALVADTAAVEQRGTAFGVFNLVTGLALLVASVLAGVLWDRGGPTLTFLTGAALTAAAGVVAFALYSLKKIDGRGAAAR